MTKKLLITDDAVIMRTIIADTARESGWEVVGWPFSIFLPTDTCR